MTQHAGPRSVDLAVVAKDAVTTVAPEQADLVTVSPARRRRDWTGGAVGSGIDPVLLGEVVGPVLLGASAEVLGAAAVAAWRGRPRWRLRRRPRPSTPDTAALPPAPVTLDAGQVRALRAACVRHGTTLGLSPSEADLLADAVEGALNRALDD